MIILCVNGDIGEGIDNDPDPIALDARQRELYLPSAGTAGGHGGLRASIYIMYRLEPPQGDLPRKWPPNFGSVVRRSGTKKAGVENTGPCLYGSPS